MSRPRTSIKGRRYGFLKVIHEVEQRGRHRRWMCQCDCGNTVEVSQDNLTSCRTKSCGCLRSVRKHDLTFQQFGILFVIREADQIGRQRYWLCRCLCGKETVVAQSSLLAGRTKSCGQCKENRKY